MYSGFSDVPLPLQGSALLTPAELAKISLDIANGAKYLEALKFIHRLVVCLTSELWRDCVCVSPVSCGETVCVSHQ